MGPCLVSVQGFLQAVRAAVQRSQVAVRAVIWGELAPDSTLSLAGWVSAWETQRPSLLAVSLHRPTLLPTGIPLRLPPLNISPPTAQQIPACLDQRPGLLEIEMWLENKYVQLCVYLMFGCLDQSFYFFYFCFDTA